MKKIIALFLCCAIGLYFSPMLSSIETTSSQENIEFQCILSDEDLTLLEKHNTDIFVHIPNAVKSAIAQLCQHVSDLDTCMDISLFLNKAIHLAPSSLLQPQIHSLCSFLSHSESAQQIPNSLARTIEQYMHDLESNTLLIDTTSFYEQNYDYTRGFDTLMLFNTNNGLAILSAGMINILGGTNISTSGSGSTVTINSTGSAASSFHTDSGVAIPSSGVLNIDGDGHNITTSGSGNTVKVALTGIIQYAVQVGGASNALTQLTPGTNGQVLLGDTGTNPSFVTPTAGTGLSLTTNASTLLYALSTPVAIANGGTNATSMATTDGVVYYDGTRLVTTAAGSSGQVLTSNGGSGSAPTFQPSSSSISITGDTGGALTGNSFTFTGGTTGLKFGGSGTTETLSGTLVVADGGTGATSLTANGVLLGHGTSAVTATAVGTNGQLLIGANSAAPAFATVTSPANSDSATSITFTTGANSLALTSLTLLGNTLIVDAINGSASASISNGLPFSTISLALTAAATIATSSRPVTIWVLPGYYNETLTMQPYVSVIGISPGAGAEGTPTSGVTVQQLNVGTTTLVTMADYSRLENVSLNLTSAGASGTNLVGISFPSGVNTSSATARVQSVMLTVNNSSAGGGTTYGVYSQGSGVPLLEIPVLRDSTIYVNATPASAQAAGIYINAAANGDGLTIQDCNINVATAGSGTTLPAALLLQTGTCFITDSTLTITASTIGALGISTATSGDSCVINNCYISATCTTTGTLLAYGIDVGAGATCNANNSSTSGTNTVTASNGNDVTNAGTLTVSNTVLVHGTTNNTMFTSIPSSLLCWTTTGTFTSTSNLQLMVGGGAASGGGTYTNAYYTASRPLTLKNLHVQTNGPLSGGSRTFTVYTGPSGSAGASSVTCTIASGAASSSDTTHSVAVSTGQVFYMLMTGAATSVANPVVTLEMY